MHFKQKKTFLLSWLNPNQAGGGWNLPEATLTACRYVLDGVRTVKPSCNFHFRCLKSFYEKKLGGCKKNFWKICDRNFFFLRKLEKKFFEIQFFQKISYTIVLFDIKYEFRMISAFIWYAYCPCRWKIIIFQKSACQKLENFSVKLGHFGVALRKN